MARKHFKPGTLTAPLPAVMVSVGDMENSNIITVAWTGILNSEPPRTYISVRPGRYSHKILTERREFVINLTNEALAYATDYSGIYTGAKVNKFEKLGLTKAKSLEVAAPTVSEAPLSLECRVFDIIPMGTHDVFMADIVSISCDDALLDENGKIHLEWAKLIAYAHGEYYALGERLGKFGFSAARKKANGTTKSATKKSESPSGDANQTKRAEKSDSHVPFYVTAPGYKKHRGGKKK